ncbi:zinc finger protein 518A-like [Carassius auratus]|uniref:Zinc finger protein 518A-like n=1 Tax=Carassius auratus TaxID=7957 RepID=A0A6P6QP22_CARAU|nr:zinc finger protein 518A-like [Carassius auratus]
MNGVKANPDAQVGNETRDNWHKRLRLRKTSFSFPVKQERNVTACGWKLTEKSKKWPRRLEAANTFTCSTCNDGISFRPRELTMHYKIAHGGEGSPPMFPCNMCNFSSPVFTTLQQHRMQHEDCLFACEICDDGVQRTLPQLTKHCQTQHALNGQYHCPKCKLSVFEIKQFVCHSCCITNGDAQKDDLLKHVTAACRQRWSRRNWWRKRPHVKQDMSQEFKLLRPKPEAQWTSQLLPFSTPGLLDDHGVFVDPEKTLEETQQFLERNICSAKNWPVCLKSEEAATTPHPSKTNAKRCVTPHTGKHKLSGLMEKNNISIPPDCTTKVIGVKMLDGKKHLVLKVIPSNNRDASKDTRTVKPADQRDESKDISIANASGNRSQVTFIKPSSQRQCVAQRDFLSSVFERIKSQQTDGCNNQEHAPVEAHIQSPRAKTAEDCQDTCQGDSGCHSDLTSDASSSEERCRCSRLLPAVFDEEHNLALDSNCINHQPNTCSISGSDCVSPSSRSPLKDGTESLCQSEAGGLLFHGNADECTNNMDPRDSLVPVESLAAPDPLHMVGELPLTTAIHLLDETREDCTLSPNVGSDEHLKDLTHAGDTSQRSDPVSLPPDVSNSSTSASVSGSSSSVVPLASLNRKRMVETSSADPPISKSQKRSEDSVLFWEPVSRDASVTLRLIPFSDSQSVKIPRDDQPVIVLNHPHTDIPEVTNIMKVVHKHKGNVQRVVLSRKTLRALSEFNCESFRRNFVAACHASHRGREWPNGTVKERFGLKLRLRRVCGRK